MPSMSSMVGQWLTNLQSAAISYASSGSWTRRVCTLLAVVCGIVWMYRRVEQARAAERRARPLLRDAHGNLLPPNIALNQHAPSPLPSNHSSSSSIPTSTDDVRLLSAHDRYLSEKGSRIRRQSVCLGLAVGGHLFQTSPDSATAGESSLQPAAWPPLAVHDALVPILMSLAQHTTLHLICVEASKERQKAILDCLASYELFNLGLKRHRVLFCTTVKGHQAIIRHIEPNLVIDEDRSMLALLKPFVDQVVHIDPRTQPQPKAEIPTFPSITHFFMPQTATS